MVTNPFVGDGCTVQTIIDFCENHSTGEIRRLVKEVAAASSSRRLTRDVRLAIAILSRMHAANLKVPPTYRQVKRERDGYTVHAFTYYADDTCSYTAIADKTGIMVVRNFLCADMMVMRCVHDQKQHMLATELLPTAQQLRQLEDDVNPWFAQLMAGMRTQIRGEIPKIIYSIAGNVRGLWYARKTEEAVHGQSDQV